MEHPVGLTQDVGYQIGVRRTLAVPFARVWHIVTSADGMTVWLGGHVDLEKGNTYRFLDGTCGAVRVYRPKSHMRITWQPPTWERASLIQVRVIEQKTGTTIAFHQEHLPDAAAREDRRQFFMTAIDQLEALLND